MELTKELFDSLVNSIFYYRSLSEELRVDVDILDAQMIALGNLLIKKGVVSFDEIKNYTNGVMGMKISEKRRERNKGFLEKPILKSELEELLSTEQFKFEPPKIEDKK